MKWCVAAIVAGLAATSMASCTRGAEEGVPRWPNLVTRAVPPAPLGSSGLSGPLRAPGGPFLVDTHGRVVFLHGVNAVYKYPPYELYPDPGKPWNFDSRDASVISELGFNVVRLGMTWSGLEPGTAPANDPSICRPGAPGDPGQFNAQVLDAYLGRLKQTVDLLGRYHVYTLLDMHQDVYNEMFDGEGAPSWAVCTDGRPVTEAPGRWSNNYSTAAADAAYHNFWTNRVAGNLQGEFDRVWTAVASYFVDDPWVVGYDPFNEPFSVSLLRRGDDTFDNQLLCFYVGKTMAGQATALRPAIHCPPADPAVGLIPRILQADSRHLVFYEPDIFSSRGGPNFVGSMDLPDLVFNIHDYCSYRSGKTGNPTDLVACAAQEQMTMQARAEDRPELASPFQPGGPPWFMSEFGATSNPELLTLLTAEADQHLVGWSYWMWKFYGDPTGSSDEALVDRHGLLKSTVTALSRPYPQALAGTPISMSFDARADVFRLIYRPNHSLQVPTVIYVPRAIHYPKGYCARVEDGWIASKTGSPYLVVGNAPVGNRVTVTLRAKGC